MINKERLTNLSNEIWKGAIKLRGKFKAKDYPSVIQMVQKIRDAIGDDSTTFGPLAELAKKTLIPRDEFARLVVPTAHTTELGYVSTITLCRHVNSIGTVFITQI